MKEARELEPNLADGIKLVMHAPTGGIVDSPAFVRAIALEAQGGGVTFRYDTRVTGAEPAGGSFATTRG